MNILLRLFNKKEYQRRKNIKTSVRQHLSSHGYSRKVKVNEGGITIGYMYMPIRQSHRNINWVGQK